MDALGVSQGPFKPTFSALIQEFLAPGLLGSGQMCAKSAKSDFSTKPVCHQLTLPAHWNFTGSGQSPLPRQKRWAAAPSLSTPQRGRALLQCQWWLHLLSVEPVLFKPGPNGNREVQGLIQGHTASKQVTGWHRCHLG